MSVADYLNKVRALHELRTTNVPECWAIVANSVNAQAEHETIVALFDTQVLADAYVAASQIPQEVTNKHLRGRYRSFRPDSLLWNYNAERSVWAQNSKDSVIRLSDLVFFGLVGPPPSNPPPPDPMDLTAMNAMLAEHALVHG